MNWKKFWFAVIGIGLPLAMLGATIRWYNDAGIPQKVNLVGTEIFSLQQTGPNAYRWSLASDIRRYMVGDGTTPTPIIYVTVINATTNYTTNAFFNYLTVYSNAYFYSTQFIAYNFTTNLTVLSNAYFYQTNFNNYEITTNLTVINQTTIGSLVVNSNAFFYQTNFVSYEFVTNLTVVESLTVQSNMTVEQTLNVRNLNVTSNIYYLNSLATNIPWAGPTNTLDFSKGSVQSYTASGAVSVTNVIGELAPYQNGTILCLTNSSANSLTNTVTATGWQIGNGDSLVFTNGQVLQLWFQNIGGMKTLATKKYSPQ